MDLIGAPYELVHVDYFKGEHKEQPYLQLNPNASVPALTDGDYVLWESNAMLQYAADLVGNQVAYPRDLKVRADINRWMQWEGSHWFPSSYVFLVENCVKPLLGGQADPAAVLNAQAEQWHKLAGNPGPAPGRPALGGRRTAANDCGHRPGRAAAPAWLATAADQRPSQPEALAAG